MYGKIFASMYDGTLGRHWEALITLQQMIVLCDSDGVVDMTVEALSRRTGIPLELIRKGIAKLEEPDPESRNPDFEGRRILRLDEHRTWGWMIANYRKYREVRDQDERRAQTRKAVAKWRAKRDEHPACKPDVSQGKPHVSQGKPRKAQGEGEGEGEEEGRGVPVGASERSSPGVPVGNALHAEPQGASAPQPAGLTRLPLNDGRERAITPEQVTEWRELYPAVDVEGQLRAMRGWLLANPERKKTARGVLRFVNGWLAKEQDRSRRRAPPAEVDARRASDARYAEQLAAHVARVNGA